MMSDERNDGGQAFPRKYFEWDYDENCRIEMSEPGMTLRDYFAAKALPSLIPTFRLGESIDCTSAAFHAYRMADAMLKARNQ